MFIFNIFYFLKIWLPGVPTACLFFLPSIQFQFQCRDIVIIDRFNISPPYLAGTVQALDELHNIRFALLELYLRTLQQGIRFRGAHRSYNNGYFLPVGGAWLATHRPCCSAGGHSLPLPSGQYRHLSSPASNGFAAERTGAGRKHRPSTNSTRLAVKSSGGYNRPKVRERNGYAPRPTVPSSRLPGSGNNSDALPTAPPLRSPGSNASVLSAGTIGLSA